MMPVEASAPGKAVLSGEYAVLRGAPAISMALDRRASVLLEPTDDAFHRVEVPGLADGSWRFTSARAASVEWLDAPPPGGLRLVEEAWRVCAHTDLPCLMITIDTRRFHDQETGSKLGLGSSAAAMTALVSALCRLAPPSADSAALARKAHSALQDGLGSGVDVATSIHGGVIEYRKADGPTARPRPWPDGLRYRFLWSGRPADTASRLRRLGRAPRDDASWTGLCAAADEVAAAWADGHGTAVLESLGRYTNALRQFGIDHDLGIFDAGHGTLSDLARSAGILYKPCGAGGGDIGMVLAGDDAAVTDFCSQAPQYGFRPLSIALDTGGVETSTEDER